MQAAPGAMEIAAMGDNRAASASDAVTRRPIRGDVWLWIPVVLAVAFGIVEIWLGRRFLLDDSLIHLRAAELALSSGNSQAIA